MTDAPEPRLHVIASFDSRDDLLAAMRRACGWIMVDEPALLAMLQGPHPPLQGSQGGQGAASAAEEPRADDDGDQDGGGPQEGAG